MKKIDASLPLRSDAKLAIFLSTNSNVFFNYAFLIILITVGMISRILSMVATSNFACEVDRVTQLTRSSVFWPPSILSNLGVSRLSTLFNCPNLVRSFHFIQELLNLLIILLKTAFPSSMTTW